MSPLSCFKMINNAKVVEFVQERLSPLLNEKNIFLVDIRITQGRKIEVYIDTDEGIHIDDCAMVSRYLEKYLDGSGLVPDNYILEVSSPGMDNPLKVPRQYRRRIGRTLEVTKMSGEKVVAELVEVYDEGIKLRETPPSQVKRKSHEKVPAPQPKEWNIHFNDIKKAVVQFNF
ncbi:MAG: hypothetical protein NZM35_03375 [Chitinophagales bacterium]|nr:hypothetical protein [Chitinophagales bacterium]MDW8418965.1 hypothetical protein [Chitinophagales bacterium]